jgi:HK97 family phage major capsid protein
MSLTVGVAGAPAWMPAGGISGLPYNTFFGRPAFPCEFLPELGNAKDIMLVDLEEYLWIYKGDITVDISPHVYFTSNQTLFRFKQAVNGMPKHDRATTLYEGTGTVSPYVYTAERA